MTYDVLIIGGGPSGVSTALYTVRGGLKTAIVTKGYGSLSKAEMVQNYYGFPKGITGAELEDAGLVQAETVGVDLMKGEIIDLATDETGLFTAKTKKTVMQARCVVLCCGSARLTPNIKGLKQLEYKGVSYCAVCDGFFYRGKAVAVIGNGDYAAEEAAALLRTSGSVTLLTDGLPAPKTESGVVIDTRKIAEVFGTDRVEGVKFSDGEALALSGVFIAIGTAGSAALAIKLGAVIESDKLVVDENMATNIPRLYAAGDCVGGMYQISKAVYEGTKAGMHIVKSLSKSDTSDT